MPSSGGSSDLFPDLPAALVNELLEKANEVAGPIVESLRTAKERRDGLRKMLERAAMLMQEADLPSPPVPTTCGVDGSYAIERLLTADLAAMAAVAVEGLTPPSEVRHWPEPRHVSLMSAEPHGEATATILRALMLGEELRLAVAAPHDVVMIDCSMTLPVIYMNQAFVKLRQGAGLRCAEALMRGAVEHLRAYREILRSKRSDKNYVALPKYTTRREVGEAVGWPGIQDDRSLLSIVLEPGELTRPCPLEQPRAGEGGGAWHIATDAFDEGVRKDLADVVESVLAAVEEIHVFYYRPRAWLPALRVEVGAAVAANPHRLATVVQALKHQTGTPSMLEPYPTYMADRMAKSLARAMPSFRQVVTKEVALRFGGDLGDVHMAMHGYRSDSGR